MFNGSSNIIIQGGTFIITGNIDGASLKEMGANIPQNSAIGSNTGQEPTTDQLCYTQEANVQESCKSHVDTAPHSHSADNFETSVHASGQVPEYVLYPMPTPSFTSVKSWEFNNVSRNAKLHAAPSSLAFKFPMPSYFSKPQYSAHALPIHFRKRHPISGCPPSHPAHSRFGPSPTSFRHQVRASTYPFPAPSPPFPYTSISLRRALFLRSANYLSNFPQPSHTVLMKSNL